MGRDDDPEETVGLAWPNAGRVIRRNSTIFKAVALVALVCLAIVLATGGVYLRSWQLQFMIQELKDYVLTSNQPDSACLGQTEGEWSYGPIEKFKTCDARQREDFTRSDKEIYDQCVETHPFAKQKNCQRGKEVRFYVFNVTNSEDVIDGLTPRIEEVGRKGDGGPFVFYEDCRTFDTEFGPKEAQFSEYCYYTYKYSSTEEADLGQPIVTVNVGLMEAIGNSVGHVDYIVAVVWGTKGLHELNTTTTIVEDYMRGQLLSFTWPNNFGSHFLKEFSEAPDFGGFQAKDNAQRLFEMVLDDQKVSCLVNGTTYDRNQCQSMANTLVIYARLYYEGFQTYVVKPYGLTYKQGAGLFVRASVGNLLGYWAGYDDPLSAYMFPKKVSWNIVRSKTQVQVTSSIRAGMADSQNGLLNAGPWGRSTIVTNTIEDLGDYKIYKGRTYITEFDWQGCRPTGESAQVVVPPDGPYPPQCNGGQPLRVRGSRGDQVAPKVWDLQPGVQESITIFSDLLMRPLKYTVVEDLELTADTTDIVNARSYEFADVGLNEARLAFNCAQDYKAMAESGVLNRGSDCDELQGMFDLSAAHNNVPYVWSLPHFYLVTAQDATQHPRNNLIGFVTPTGPRYRNMVVVERESGKVVQQMFKDQISVRLYKDARNVFFTKHKSVVIPLFWRVETKNSTVADLQLLSMFQSSFKGLEAGFIACCVTGAISLMLALFVGMLLYRENSLHAVEEKRKQIQAELASAVPPDEKEDRDLYIDGGDEKDFM